jgi:drug/metabolite transporter (DMT)-like permease
MPVIPRRELWLFIGVVVFWGINWPIMKLAMAELDFWVFRTYCVLAGLAWFLGYNLKAGVSLAVPRALWPRLAASALCNVAGWNILSAAGLSMLPSGRAGILAYTMPLWLVLLSRVFLGEALTWARMIALTLGMTGIALLLVDEFHTLKSAPVGALLMVDAHDDADDLELSGRRLADRVGACDRRARPVAADGNGRVVRPAV